MPTQYPTVSYCQQQNEKTPLPEFVWVEKAGVVTSAAKGDVVAGPCVFYLRNAPPADALLTLERWTVKKSR